MIKKVLLTNMYAGFGGGERCILDHIRILHEGGVSIDLILFEKGEFSAAASKSGASVTEMSFQWQGSKLRSLLLIFQRIFQFRAFLRKHKPDVHIAYTLNDLILVGLASRSLAIPIVYRAQADVFGTSSGHLNTWLGILLLPLLKFLSPMVICSTGYERDNLIRLGFSANKIKHIPLGVDMDRFQPDPTASAQLRCLYGYADRPVVAMFGRLVSWKGQKTFISSLIELKKRGIDVCAWIVGGADFGDGDDYIDELKSLARDLEDENAVKFLGFRDDVNHLMAASDVVCHASDFEPFGMVIIEAMALGRPVVASDVSGPRESVLEGETGYLFPAGDSKSMADQLAILLSDHQLRKKMGLAGQRRVYETFDLTRNMQRLHEECVKLIQCKK